jgi:hypothetical protein
VLETLKKNQENPLRVQYPSNNTASQLNENVNEEKKKERGKK